MAAKQVLELQVQVIDCDITEDKDVVIKAVCSGGMDLMLFLSLAEGVQLGERLISLQQHGTLPDVQV